MMKLKVTYKLVYFKDKEGNEEAFVHIKQPGRRGQLMLPLGDAFVQIQELKDRAYGTAIEENE